MAHLIMRFGFSGGVTFRSRGMKQADSFILLGDLITLSISTLGDFSNDGLNPELVLALNASLSSLKLRSGVKNDPLACLPCFPPWFPSTLRAKLPFTGDAECLALPGCSGNPPPDELEFVTDLDFN